MKLSTYILRNLNPISYFAVFGSCILFGVFVIFFAKAVGPVLFLVVFAAIVAAAWVHTIKRWRENR